MTYRKALAIVLFSGLLFACNEKPKTKIHMNEMHKHNPQFQELKEDILNKYNSLTEVQKLTLCLQEYSFKYPEDFEDLVDDDPENFVDRLRNDEKFIALCKKKNLDHTRIPDDFREIVSGENE